MVAKDYEFDAFISYSSTDRPWATRLEEALRAKHLNCFLDQKRLHLGDRWEPSLLESLERSRHLVLIWSDAAKNSDWVNNERFRFVVRAEKSVSDTRRVIIVALQGQPKALDAYQIATELKDPGIYAAGAEDAPSLLWNQVVSRVASSIDSDENAVRIPILICTTTRARLDQVDGAHVPPDAPSLDSLLADLGIGDKQMLREFYGTGRQEWRPFASQDPIGIILDRLKDDINAHLMGRALRWDFIDDAFWTEDMIAIERETDKLTTGPAVIVIDPLALYDDLVESRFRNWLYRCFDNENALVLLLPPFAMNTPTVRLRSLVYGRAKQIFDYVYRPPVARLGKSARCSVNVGDEMEVKGWIFSAVGPCLLPAPTTDRSPYLDIGKAIS